MTWSFSRINSFNNCKLAWYINYLSDEDIVEETNFFSEFGLFIHKIMEKYNKDELEIFELEDYYNKNYLDNIVHTPPSNKYIDLGDLYYQNGKDFLLSFNGYKDKTIGAEMGIKFRIPYISHQPEFIGYIDRLSRDENGIIITDYKSKSKFNSKKEKEHYLLQLYLYSYGIYNTYKEYPYKLRFDMFRSQIVIEELFNKNKMYHALDWVSESINSIYKEKQFLPRTENTEKDFFCTYLCAFRTRCYNFKL